VGVDIRLKDCLFRIPVERHREAFLALGETWGRKYPGRNLAEMIRSVGWEAVQDEDYSIVGLRLRTESQGDMLGFFRSLAPYVEDGSYIQLYAPGYEESWRWNFREGKLYYQTPEVRWPSDTWGEEIT
jgi:hypothetical protein